MPVHPALISAQLISGDRLSGKVYDRTEDGNQTAAKVAVAAPTNCAVPAPTDT
jgi:hypothetical protein